MSILKIVHRVFWGSKFNYYCFRLVFYGVVGVGLVGCDENASEKDLRDVIHQLYDRAFFQNQHLEKKPPEELIIPADSLRSPFQKPTLFAENMSAPEEEKESFAMSDPAANCDLQDLYYLGWIGDQQMMRAWLSCPNGEIWSVGTGEMLRGSGAWVASISRERLQLYSGADFSSGQAQMISLPFRGRSSE